MLTGDINFGGMSDLRNEGGMLSEPAALLPFIFFLEDSNLPI